MFSPPPLSFFFCLSTAVITLSDCDSRPVHAVQLGLITTSSSTKVPASVRSHTASAFSKRASKLVALTVGRKQKMNVILLFPEAMSVHDRVSAFISHTCAHAFKWLTRQGKLKPPTDQAERATTKHPNEYVSHQINKNPMPVYHQAVTVYPSAPSMSFSMKAQKRCRLQGRASNPANPA